MEKVERLPKSFFPSQTSFVDNNGVDLGKSESTVYFDQQDEEEDENYTVVSTLEDENFVVAALFGAVEDGNLNAIQELFSMSKIDANQCNRHGESLLHYCAGLGYIEILKFLHKKGADISLIDDRGDSILHWAARQNHPSIIRYFYDNLTNVNQLNKNLETPLHVAARYGHVESIEQLCKCGADVNAVDEHGETAMLIAVWHGFPKIVHILGEVGAQTDIRNKEGETALHVASARGHLECVRCLLEAGARTDFRNKNNYTPLHLSLKRQHVGVASLLLRIGSDFESADDHGERPIHYVSRYNLLEICQSLCYSGCNVNVPNKSGLYPLHLAAKNGHIEIVRCLCLSGSVVDQKNRDSMTPQICAIAQSHNEIADLLTRLTNEQMFEEFKAQLVPKPQPLQRMMFKIFGHSGCGKTTLIESLKCGYFSSWFRKSSKSLSGSRKLSESSNYSNGEPSTPTSSQFEFNNNCKINCENSTLGIDIQHLTITGVGDMSIWEFSGNECYFQVYDHFIGNTCCLHAIVFCLSDPIEVQIHSIMFWLYFLQSRISVLEPLTSCGKSTKPAKVVIIATHADVVNTSSDDIKSNLKSLIQTVNNSFKNIFDIHDNIFVMDANAVGSPAMKSLKQYLNSMKSVIFQEMPLSNGFLDSVLTFLDICRKASTNFPVLSWIQFKEIIRSQINPLASDEHLRELIQQLQVMGEILYLKAKVDNSQDLVVLNPRWLTVEVIGYLLSKDYLSKNCISGTYSIDDIQLEYPETDALDLLQVLESISVCAQCDQEGDIEYEFPCFTIKEASDDIWDKNIIQFDDYIYSGLSIQCEKHIPSGQLLLCLFPRLQISLRLAIKGHPYYNDCELSHWFKASKLSIGPIEAILTSNIMTESIEIKFRGPLVMRTDCLLFMEDILNIIETTLTQICPGIIFEKNYLSPSQLKLHDENVSQYSSYSISKALLSSDNKSVLKQKVKSIDSVKEEIIADIISFGIYDLNCIVKETKFRSIIPLSSLMETNIPAFNPSDGGPLLMPNLHSSNLSLLTKQRLCSVLDPSNEMGCDWCMFGILLGMTDKLPKLDPGLNAHLSPTSRVFDECIRESSLTIGVLVKKLEELNRHDAIDVILQTGPLIKILPSISQPECLPHNDESGTVSSGISRGSLTSSSNLSR